MGEILRLCGKSVTERTGGPDSSYVVVMRLKSGFFAAAWLSLVIGLLIPVRAQQAASAACRVIGKAVSGTTALPGVSVMARLNDAITAATSTELDGTYTLAL